MYKNVLNQCIVEIIALSRINAQPLLPEYRLTDRLSANHKICKP
jgi:hypothetical protein